MTSTSLCPFSRTADGQWLGTMVASDGRCYFGSSTHDNKHGAGFFRYDPTDGLVTRLAEDLTAVCGENVRFTPPQCKLHSDIVEFNGWLYFSTHLGNEWDQARIAYTGGHVIGYSLSAGTFRDFGVVRSNYTCYSAVGVDPVRGKLLSFVTRYWDNTGSIDHPTDSHLYRFDIASGTKADLGVVPGFTSFYFFIDPRGDCWFSCEDDNGALRVIRSATGAIERFDNVLPEPSLGTSRWWDWAKALSDGNSCAFKMANGNYFYTFRSDVFQTNHAAAFTTLRFVGPVPSGVAMDSNRIYYVQRANQQPGNQGFTDFHLLSVPIYANTPIVDHGLIMDQSGRLVWRLPGLAVDNKNHLYGVGDWWLLPGEQGTVVGTLRHEDVNNSSNYFAFPRGQFFATINLPQSPLGSNMLMVATAGGGTVSTTPPGSLFARNTIVTLTATPSNGWSFLGWQGDFNGTNPVAQVVVTHDEAVQAVFGTTLDIGSIAGPGKVSRTPSATLCPYGTMVRLTAMPISGAYFSNWGRDGSGSISPLDFLVTNANPIVYSYFYLLSGGQVALTMTVNGRGHVTVSPRASYYPIGQTVTLTAIPDAGQSFTGWSNGASGSANPLSLQLNQSRTVTANFTSGSTLAAQPLFGDSFGVRLFLNGEVGASYQVDATTNFVDWAALGSLTNISGSSLFTDPDAAAFDHRFYRAQLVP